MATLLERFGQCRGLLFGAFETQISLIAFIMSTDNSEFAESKKDSPWALKSEGPP